MKKKVESKLSIFKKNIDNSIKRGKEVVALTKEGAREVIKVTDNIQNTLNSATGLTRSVTGIKDSFIESQKIQAKTKVELDKIRSNHQNINRIMSEEYGKQKEAMDKASDVVDNGLATDNINKIREGLNAMTNVANHNPMEKIKTELDKKLERNLNQDFDDDFTLEF